MERVIRHIYRELSEPTQGGLSLETLSQVACFSKFHFQRIFSAYFGMGTAQYIQQLKLKRACYQLTFMPAMKIIDIALDAGFENHESFSRAFKRHHQQTPTDFRNNPNWSEFSHQQTQAMTTHNISIEVDLCDFPTTQLAVLEHLGNPNHINQTVAKFIQWRMQTDESPIRETLTIGLAYHDPATTPPDEYRYDVCSSVFRPVKENNYGIIDKTLPGGRCARIVHHGPYELMGDKIRYLYQHWLPDNEAELRDFPCFFVYRKLFPETAENDLITEIYLPIE